MARRKTRSVTVYHRVRRERRERFGFGNGSSLAVLGGFVPAILDSIRQGQARNYPNGPGFWSGFFHQLTLDFTGYNSDDKKFYAGFNGLLKGWAPVIAGIMIHRVAQMTGISRMLRRILPIGI